MVDHFKNPLHFNRFTGNARVAEWQTRRTSGLIPGLELSSLPVHLTSAYFNDSRQVCLSSRDGFSCLWSTKESKFSPSERAGTTEPKLPAR